MKLRMLVSSLKCPISINLSASSSTKVLNLGKASKKDWFTNSFRKAHTHPGVPITIAGRSLSSRSYFSIDMLPSKRQTLNRLSFLYLWGITFSQWSLIYTANSLVGVTIKAWMWLGLLIFPFSTQLINYWMIGSKKQSVFPSPVHAEMIRSYVRYCKLLIWTSVGVT